MWNSLILQRLRKLLLTTILICQRVFFSVIMSNKLVLLSSCRTEGDDREVLGGLLLSLIHI